MQVSAGKEMVRVHARGIVAVLMKGHLARGNTPKMFIPFLVVSPPPLLASLSGYFLVVFVVPRGPEQQE